MSAFECLCGHRGRLHHIRCGATLAILLASFSFASGKLFLKATSLLWPGVFSRSWEEMVSVKVDVV